MNRLTIFIMIAALVGVLYPVNAASCSREKRRAEVLARGRGFYKDVFMDGGIALASRHFLPATRFLGLSIDHFASAARKNLTKKDSLLQSNIFCGSENDTNGWLLYPDGAPRFRMVYVNGGNAALHAQSLTEQGRANLRRFVAAGDSYVGNDTLCYGRKSDTTD